MKNDQNDKKDQKHPTRQNQNEGNRQNTGDNKSEKHTSSRKADDEEVHVKNHSDHTTGSVQAKSSDQTR